MPVEITATGSDSRVLEQVAKDGGHPVTHQGNTRNKIEQVADDAGAGAVPWLSDAGAILWLAENLAGFTWALSGEFAALASVQAATVSDDWTTSVVDGAGNFGALTDPLALIPMWEGVRWMEAINPSATNKVIGASIIDGTGLQFAVRRENSGGSPGNTHWAFYIEQAGVGVVAVERVEAADTTVPAIGVDGATGQCMAVIDDSEVVLPSAFDDALSGSEGVFLMASIAWGTGTGSGEITMVALKEQGYSNTLTGFDMRGDAL